MSDGAPHLIPDQYGRLAPEGQLYIPADAPETQRLNAQLAKAMNQSAEASRSWSKFSGGSLEPVPKPFNNNDAMNADALQEKQRIERLIRSRGGKP